MKRRSWRAWVGTSVVLGVAWVGQVKDNGGVGSGAATVRKDSWEVDGSVEAEAAVVEDIDILSHVVGGGVQNTNVTSLDKVIGNDDVLLVWRDLQVVRSDNWLYFAVGIESLDVVEIGYVQLIDVVGSGGRNIHVFGVFGDGGEDGDGVAGLLAEIEEELAHTGLARDRVGSLWVDDPDLPKANGSRYCSTLLVSWNELDILDTAAVGDLNAVQDCAGVEIPKADAVASNDAGTWLEDGDGNDEVGSEDVAVLEVDGETVGRELAVEHAQHAWNIFWPLVDDVVVCVGFDETSWGCSDCRAHVGEEEASIRLGHDIVGDGCEKSSVTLQELWLVCGGKSVSDP